MSTTEQKTVVEKMTTTDLDNLFTTPGLPDVKEDDPKNRMFENPGDHEFFDNQKKDPENDEGKGDGEEEGGEGDENKGGENNNGGGENNNSGAATPIGKDTATLISGLIEKNLLRTFEGDTRKIEEYSPEELEELLAQNFAERDEEDLDAVRSEFFNSLPREFQVAADYYSKGGKDLKSLLSELQEVEEIRDFDLTKPKDQENLVRSYLQSINFGTAEEIDEEVTSIKDRGELEKKAQQHKPKLDTIRKAKVAKRLEEQDRIKNNQLAAAQRFYDNAYKALDVDALNGIKLSRKDRDMLFSGLTKTDHPSISGRNTNRLGYLLEKYQFGNEPRFDLVAQALMLLENPEKFYADVKSLGATDTSKKTAVALKTAQQTSKGGSGAGEEKENNNNGQRKTLKRGPSKSFFARE